MQLIDTHCHIDLPIFTEDVQEILTNCKTNDISTIVVPGVCQSGWANLLQLCTQHSILHPALGLHPMYLRYHTAKHLEELHSHIKHCPLVALGEIGLDYFIKDGDHLKQQELFEAQLQLADQFDLPVLLHARKAHDQVLATLRRLRFKHGGIIHAFNGSFQQAQHYIGLGFKISFCGTVTYDRARKIRRLAVELNLEDMVIETDSPDLPPKQHHGKRNVPTNLLHVVNTLATLRGQPKEDIATLTGQNTKTVLQL